MVWASPSDVSYRIARAAFVRTKRLFVQFRASRGGFSFGSRVCIDPSICDVIFAATITPVPPRRDIFDRRDYFANRPEYWAPANREISAILALPRRLCLNRSTHRMRSELPTTRENSTELGSDPRGRSDLKHPSNQQWERSRFLGI